MNATPDHINRVAAALATRFLAPQLELGQALDSVAIADVVRRNKLATVQAPPERSPCSLGTRDFYILAAKIAIEALP